jgi:glycosyltransferase involved in cell wall biosynthesis
MKVGLFLGAEPSAGGMYQYNQSILDAVLNLPADEFEIIIAYSHPEWKNIVPSHIRQILVRPSRLDRWVFKFRHFFSVEIWRKISRKLHGPTRKMAQLEQDLWIFPTQDIYSYSMPVHSLSVVHDLMHRYERRFPEVGGLIEYLRRERHYRSLCKYASGILVDSEVGRQHVLESYHAKNERVHTLPYIAPKYMTEPSGDVSSYNLPERFIFYPAQFWSHKNHNRLILALKQLSDKYADLKLVLVGSKKNGFESAMQLVQKLDLQDRVQFLGYVPDALMSNLYRKATALVMPTFFGPTNIPPLEAFVANCPVAISDVYGMRDQCGEAALYFNPNSVEEIAGAIEQIWGNQILRQRLIAEGKKKAESWNQSAFNARFLEIMRSLRGASQVRSVRA